MKPNQVIQYCRAPDGVRIAYSVIGKGSPVVRPSHWLTHLEYDLKSPLAQPIVLGMSDRHAFIRFDARGEGMSQRDVTDISFDLWLSDLETVVNALELERFALLGISQGSAVAIAYAARHPERVSRMILYGGFARGSLHQSDIERQRRVLELSRMMVREGWGSDQQAYRQWFTSQFLPGASAEQARWFNDLELVSATPEIAEKHVAATADIDVFPLLKEITTPTIVLHCRGDLRVPFSSGEELAANIPGAKFVPLDGQNHIFLAGEPAHRAFADAVASFLGDPPVKGPLPGTAGRSARLQTAVARVEQNWLVKIIVIFAAISGVAIFFVELWRMFHG